MSDPLTLDYEVVERDGLQDRLLLVIHGYGEDRAALLDWCDTIDPAGSYRMVAPRGPFHKDGHPLWHRSLAKGTPEPLEQYFTSVRAIDRLLDVLEERFDLARSDAVVGGFSQGGGITLGLLHLSDCGPPPSAVYGVCSFVPWTTGIQPNPTRVGGRPILITAADDDRFALPGIALEGARSLADEGAAVTFVEVAGDHVVTADSAAALGTWLAQVHAREIPKNL